MTNKSTTEELIERFFKRGGRINKFYLQNTSKGKPTLVYFKGWHSGHNIREAIMKALSTE